MKRRIRELKYNRRDTTWNAWTHLGDGIRLRHSHSVSPLFSKQSCPIFISTWLATLRRVIRHFFFFFGQLRGRTLSLRFNNSPSTPFISRNFTYLVFVIAIYTSEQWNKEDPPTPPPLRRIQNDRFSSINDELRAGRRHERPIISQNLGVASKEIVSISFFFPPLSFGFCHGNEILAREGNIYIGGSTVR